jgi:hypothetical protein
MAQLCKRVNALLTRPLIAFIKRLVNAVKAAVVTQIFIWGTGPPTAAALYGSDQVKLLGLLTFCPCSRYKTHRVIGNRVSCRVASREAGRSSPARRYR